MTGIVDPTKAGKYPVVLSDALLGKDPKEIYTGVRYNHKPTLSSPTAPAQARIKPSSSKKGAPSYDLSFQDDGGRYQYKGTRGAEENQYVMIFDAAREVFVIHKVDSMFNMNLVQTPSNDNAASLRQEYPQLESHSGSTAKPAGKQSAKAKNEEKKTAAKPRKPAPKSKAQEKPSAAIPDKKPPPKPTTTTKKQRPAAAESEEESSDDDLGLTIENPGGSAPNASRDFSPNLFGIRPFSTFEPQNEEEEQDDADGEDDDDDYEHFKLPSPINHPVPERSAPQPPPQPDDADEEEDEEMEDVPQEQPANDEDLAMDDEDLIEAALLEELEGAQESDVSEEE
ncbi:RNA polymerase II transcription elongation factor-domain-containing protein [Hypoxylon rubiginosum]|uniref:RNA polymerase II transcription elongation factor-domain-containing protein n=1 Tax=Hypoxylon rubiginosum TaxID=110542 RepID=A0ACB9Z3X3_9PEZI|nr:RNA polymerase II transcription elongation factor-domain-containing protein [Hypoxylon rubiginosum]